MRIYCPSSAWNEHLAKKCKSPDSRSRRQKIFYVHTCLPMVSHSDGLSSPRPRTDASVWPRAYSAGRAGVFTPFHLHCLQAPNRGSNDTFLVFHRMQFKIDSLQSQSWPFDMENEVPRQGAEKRDGHVPREKCRHVVDRRESLLSSAILARTKEKARLRCFGRARRPEACHSVRIARQP